MVLKDKLVHVIVEGHLLTRIMQVISKFAIRVCRKLDGWCGNIIRFFVYNRKKSDMHKIVFMTFQGQYTCNPKYITEELIRRNKDVDIVWSLRGRELNRDDNMVPEGVRVVEQYTKEFFDELSTAKVWVSNSIDFFRRYLPRRKDQVVIQTWHGSLGIKRFDKESYKSSKAWVRAAIRCGKGTDYCISNSTFEDEIYKTTYWQDSAVLEYGHPRNDLIINQSAEDVRVLRESLFEFMQVEDRGQKILLYAPTFRDDHNFDVYDVDFEALHRVVTEKFGGEWLILCRYHPTVSAMGGKKMSRWGYVRNVTNYPDMQELIILTDIAVTDYSSWIYDFILSRKPGFIYATDYELYKDERGFAYPLDTTPFSISQSNEQLHDAIRAFNYESYSADVESFLTEKGCMEDGKASARTVDKILQIMDL